MEPRVSMSVYALANVFALGLLATIGFADIAATAAVSLLALGLLLFLSYWRRRPLRPSHRKRLDRLVLLQWLGTGSVGLAEVLVIAWRDVHVEVRSLFAAVVFAGSAIAWTVFASSLVDWYRVLPRVSGIVRPGPCEAPGDPRWVKVTNLWFFHRGLATLLVAAIVPAVPGYMLNEAGTGGSQAFWLAVTSVALLPSGYFVTRALTAGWWSLNPPLHLGDGIRRHDEEGTHTVWIVDVSLQGAKFIALDEDDRYRRARFPAKHEGIIGLFELGRVRKRAIEAPCAEHCSGINWYCRENPRAHD